MSSLTQLTSLDVHLCGDELAEVGFSWLGSLTGLQDLGFHAQQDMELPSDLTELTSLTKLWLASNNSEDSRERACLHLSWGEMRALRSLFVDSGLYFFDGRLLQIVGCTTLEELHFSGLMPDCPEPAKFFAAL